MLTKFALYQFPYLCIYLMDYTKVCLSGLLEVNGGTQQQSTMVKNDGLHFGSRWGAVRWYHLRLHEQGLRLLP